MTRRIVALVAPLLLVGCAPATEPTPAPTSPAPVASPGAMPEGAVPLESFGFEHAPAQFPVPESSVISDRVDQTNAIVAVFTAPSGLELAAFFRDAVQAYGCDVTADGQNSLLFGCGEFRGAFTVNGQFAALSIRNDGVS